MSSVARYLDQIFEYFPQKADILAYKENLCAQMEVVLKAECASGKTEEEALSIAIASAPSYEEIYDALNIGVRSRECDSVWYRKRVKLMSFWYALAIALFVASPFGMIGLSVWKHVHHLVAGLVILFFFIGAGIGILVYAIREKRILSELLPEKAPAPVRIWSLLLGVLFCLFALVGLVFCLHTLPGKILSRECASSLLDLSVGVLFLVWYSQRKHWNSR